MSNIQNYLFTARSCLKKPPLFKRMLAGYAQSLSSQTGPLRFMDVSVGYECNLSCTHCSAEALKRGDRVLTLAEYRLVADEAMACGVMAFHFTGGEPLLRPDLMEVIQAFRPDRNFISIASNGWFVTDLFLKDYKAVGGDAICISVDSVLPETHDEFRNRSGSWKKAVEALRLAKTYDLRTLLSATVTHQTMSDGSLEELTRFSKELGAILSLNLAVPAGNWQGCMDFILTADDRANLNAHIKANPHVRTDFQSNWRVRGCPAMKEKCYLTPYGDIIPCPFIHVTFGNVRNQSLGEIREQALRHKWMNEYHPVCIAAESREFIETAGCYGVDHEEFEFGLPLDYRESGAFCQ